MQMCPPTLSRGSAQQRVPFPCPEWHRGPGPGAHPPSLPQRPPPNARNGSLWCPDPPARRGCATGSLGEQRRHCACLVAAAADQARRGQGDLLGSSTKCLGVCEGSDQTRPRGEVGDGLRGCAGSPQASWRSWLPHWPRVAGGGGKGVPWLCCSTPHLRAPGFHPGRHSPTRAHLRLGHGHGQELPEQEQGQGGGSGHGCSRALSSGSGRWRPGLRTAGGRGGRWAGRQFPPRRQCTSPPFSRAHLGLPRRPSPPGRAGQGEKKRPSGIFWPASELKLSPRLMSYTHTPFSKK